LLNSPNTTQAALVVTSLVGLRNIEAMKVRQKADANRGLLDLFIKQVYEDENQQTWEELNIEALVQHQDFIQPTI